jgi:tetratricopeptide (TPR) repeat protein
MIAMIALATVAVYWRVSGFQFINYDDYAYVLTNYHVWPGITWTGVQWAFQTNGQRFWMPLAWISYMADCQLFGVSAGASHVTNVALHLLASGALFLFLLQATGRRVRSAFVTALFALHPLHVESVAWIAERKDVLCAWFWFLTLWAWVKYGRSGNRSWYAAAFLLCVAGLLSKPMIVTMPALLLIVDFWPLKRRYTPALLWEKTPFVLLALAGSAMAVASQRYINFGQISPGLRAANALDNIWIYIFRSLWPFSLELLYPFPAAIAWWQPALAATALVTSTVVAVWARHRAPWLLAGWLWYLITLLPVLGLVQTGVQGSVDHYMYVPLVGLAIIAAWGGAALVPRWPVLRRPALIAAAAVCVFLAVVAQRQVRWWRDSETLFEHTLQVDPSNYVVWVLLGTRDEEKGRMAEAHVRFETALQLRPDYWAAYEAMAGWYAAQKRPEDALDTLEHELQLEPNSAQVWESLGVALLEAGRPDEALEDLRFAENLAPGAAPVHAMLGSALAATGTSDEAIEEYEKAVALDPFDSSHLRTMARLWYSTGPAGIPEALNAYERAVAVDPMDAANHAGLGAILASTANGRQEAIRELEIAQKLHWEANVDERLRRLASGSSLR